MSILLSKLNYFLRGSSKAPEMPLPPLRPFSSKPFLDRPCLDPLLIQGMISRYHGDHFFKKLIHRDLEMIGKTEIGIRLLQEVMIQAVPLSISPGSMTGIETTHDSGALIQINPNKRSEVFSTADETGSRFLFELPSFLCLAHELIHYLHLAQEGRLHLSTEGVLPGFPNIEEQYAITGLKPRGYSRGPSTSSLSEHALCEAYDCPKRDVYGIFIPKTPNERANLHQSWGRGWTALHFAVARGQEKAVDTWLSQGTHIDILGPYGLTPFMVAIQYDQWKIAHLLAERGADIRIQAPSGWTPLIGALEEKWAQHLSQTSCK